MKFSLPVVATLASVEAVLAQQTTDKCSPVHIFLAKGNNEPYPGRQGKLVKAICGGLPDGDCDYEDIKFNNPYEAPYCGSVEEGAVNGAAQIKAYSKKCPESKLVVSGYSQGGQVVGDVLGGGGGVFFQDCVQKPNPALDANSAAGKQIVAALIFGDTRHTANQDYNYLDGANKDGLFPRPADQLAGLDAFAGVLRNYCPKTDPICAQGKDGATHLNYFDVYSDSAAEWVVEMIEKASGGDDDEADDDKTSASETKTSAESISTQENSSTQASTEAEETTEVESSTGAEETKTSAAPSSSTGDASSSSSDTSSQEPKETGDGNEGSEKDDADGSAGMVIPSVGLLVAGLIAAIA